MSLKLRPVPPEKAALVPREIVLAILRTNVRHDAHRRAALRSRKLDGHDRGQLGECAKRALQAVIAKLHQELQRSLGAKALPIFRTKRLESLLQERRRLQKLAPNLRRTGKRESTNSVTASHSIGRTKNELVLNAGQPAARHAGIPEHPLVAGLHDVVPRQNLSLPKFGNRRLKPQRGRRS